MNCLLITVSSILLGVSSSFGHSIAKLEAPKDGIKENFSTASQIISLINASAVDVYEIKEDNAANSIAFINPKPEKPTLREIVFYHLVERPFDKDNTKPVENEVDGPDFDRRSFTNSHGYPFLGPEAKDGQESKSSEEYNDEGDYYYEEVPINPGLRKPPPVMALEIEENKDSESSEESAEKKKENIFEEHSTQTPEIVATEAGELHPPSKTTTEKPEIDVTEASSVLPSTTTEINEVSSTTEKQMDNKAKRTRKLLFDLVKEKYSIKNNEQSSTPQPEVSTNSSTSAPVERRKRAISSMHIPEAPKLEKLSTDDLPPYLQSLIPTEKPRPKSAKLESDESDEDEGMEKIKNKMRGLIDNLKSKNSEENSREESDEDHAPRTYGMNLTPEGGYVWNDMWSDPGVYYSVEEPESVKEKFEEIMEEAEKESPPEKDYYKDDNRNKEKEHEDPMKTKDVEEDFDIEVRVDRPKHNNKKPVEHNNNEHDNKTKENAHRENAKDNKNHENVNINDLRASKTNDEVHNNDANDGKAYDKAPEDKKPEEHDHEESDQIGFRSKSVLNADDDGDDDDFEDKFRKGNKKGHKDENLVDELIENEQFWSWLADWTAIYMDVVTEHIKDQIQEEVSKQMQLYAEDHKTEKAQEESDKPIKYEENSEDSLKTKDKQDSEQNDNDDTKNQNEDMTTGDHKEFNNTNKENKVDATANSSNSEKGSPAKVEAHNLYGNSIGSDQVTNIFIFYPNKEADGVIEDLKPNNMSVPGLQVFGSLVDKNNEPIKDNKKQDDTSERENDKTEKPLEEKQKEENSKPNDSLESKNEMLSQEGSTKNESEENKSTAETLKKTSAEDKTENSESKDDIVKNSDFEGKNDSNGIKEDGEKGSSHEEIRDDEPKVEETIESSPEDREDDENSSKDQNEETEKLDSNSEHNGIESKSD